MSLFFWTIGYYYLDLLFIILLLIHVKSSDYINWKLVLSLW